MLNLSDELPLCCGLCLSVMFACVGNLSNFLVKLNLVLRNNCVVAFVRIMI